MIPKIDIQTNFYVYGLRVVGAEEYFYVGMTSKEPKQRLSVHLCHAKSGKETNKRKVDVIIKNDFRVVVDVFEVLADKKMCSDRETYWINKLFQDGHPITNIQGYSIPAVKEKAPWEDEEYAEKIYNFRTTTTLMTLLKNEAKEMGVSVNRLVNIIIYERYYGEIKTTK